MGFLVLELFLLSTFFHQTLQADFKRTIIFIRVDTDYGEDVFLRGGARCSTGSCPIPIKHRIVPSDVSSSGFYHWSRGDNYLDWDSHESSQHSYKGVCPAGTPMMWTTDKHVSNGPTVAHDGFGFTDLNTFGSNFWMSDIDMDCSETDNGWFELKAYTSDGSSGMWEPDVDQTEVCGGDSSGRRPYQAIQHMARCGMMNIFYYANYGCTIMNITNVKSSSVAGACGQRKTQRIVNGSPSSPGQWPWMLEVMYKNNHGCGAVLIAPTWAITAGHCVRTAKTYGPWATIVRAGETNRHSISGREQDYFVKNIIKHPLFDKTKPNHDIAILEMLTPIYTETDDVTPACLPVGFSLDEFVGKQCWAIGWGSTAGTGDRMKLQEVKMNVSTNSQCVQYYGKNVTRRDVCAGHGTKSACGGDSGSPLSCNVMGRWYSVGVVSWGDDGCQGRPTVFTRISAYFDWIQSATGITLFSIRRYGSSANWKSACMRRSCVFFFFFFLCGEMRAVVDQSKAYNY